MTRYAQVTNGTVENIIVADESFALANGLVACTDASPGWLYADGVFTPPPPDLEAMAYAVRLERDNKLAASDWTQVADAPVDKAAWATYRQALRDITTQQGFPQTVTWPTEPA